PAAAFAARADARDPIAVWERTGADAFVFYAVNRTARPAQVRLELTGGGAVTRLSTGEAVPLSGGAFSVQLEPFQILAYRASASTRISRAYARGGAPAAGSGSSPSRTARASRRLPSAFGWMESRKRFAPPPLSIAAAGATTWIPRCAMRVRNRR